MTLPSRCRKGIKAHLAAEPTGSRFRKPSLAGQRCNHAEYPFQESSSAVSERSPRGVFSRLRVTDDWTRNASASEATGTTFAIANMTSPVLSFIGNDNGWRMALTSISIPSKGRARLEFGPGNAGGKSGDPAGKRSQSEKFEPLAS